MFRNNIFYTIVCTLNNFSNILWLSHKTDESFKFHIDKDSGVWSWHFTKAWKMSWGPEADDGEFVPWARPGETVFGSRSVQRWHQVFLLTAISVVVIVDGLVTSSCCWGSHWFTTYNKRFTTTGPLYEWITWWGEWIPVYMTVNVSYIY